MDPTSAKVPNCVRHLAGRPARGQRLPPTRRPLPRKSTRTTRSHRQRTDRGRANRDQAVTAAGRRDSPTNWRTARLASTEWLYGSLAPACAGGPLAHVVEPGPLPTVPVETLGAAGASSLSPPPAGTIVGAVMRATERNAALRLVAAAERSRYKVRRVDRMLAADEARLVGDPSLIADRRPGLTAVRPAGSGASAPVAARASLVDAAPSACGAGR